MCHATTSDSEIENGSLCYNVLPTIFRVVVIIIAFNTFINMRVRLTYTIKNKITTAEWENNTLNHRKGAKSALGQAGGGISLFK